MLRVFQCFIRILECFWNPEIVRKQIMQIILARLDETDFQFGVLHFLISLFKRKFKNFLQIFFRMIRTISFFGNPLNSFAQYLPFHAFSKVLFILFAMNSIRMFLKYGVPATEFLKLKQCTLMCAKCIIPKILEDTIKWFWKLLLREWPHVLSKFNYVSNSDEVCLYKIAV